MNTIAKSILAVALLSPVAANAVTSGSCSSSSAGSVTLSGVNGLVGSGTPSSGTNETETSGVCSTQAIASLSGSANDGSSSSIDAGGYSSSSVATSGNTLTLSGDGEVILQVNFEYSSLQSVDGSDSSATTLEQSFTLSPDEQVNYSLNLILGSLTNALPYGVVFDPSISVTLSSGSGPATSFVSGPAAVGGGGFSFQESSFTGNLVNTTDALAVYTLTGIVNSPDQGVDTGDGEHFANAEDDYAAYGYSLALTPTFGPVPVAAPEIDTTSGASGLALLVGGLVIISGRKRKGIAA